MADKVPKCAIAAFSASTGVRDFLSMPSLYTSFTSKTSNSGSDTRLTCENNQPMNSIHDRIKERRTALKLSMEDLAAKVDARSWQTVQQWEKQGGTAPSRKRLPLVAKALDVSVNWLISGDNDGAMYQAVSRVSRVREPEVVALPRNNMPPEIAEVVRMMEATDDAGRKQVLAVVSALLAAHQPVKKQGLAG